jgi:hypothetical protein
MKTATNIPSNTQSTDLQHAIAAHINEPEKLENLYRSQKAAFESAFNRVYPTIQSNLSAQIWNQRLNHPSAVLSSISRTDLVLVFVAALVSGLIANFNKIIGVEPDVFLQRNIGFVVFPMLIVFFGIKHQLKFGQLALPVLSVLASVFYINGLPQNSNSDVILLAALHLPIFLWSMLGYTFVRGNLRDASRKLDFLRFNGDFTVMTAIIFLSGVVFTALTIGLFGIIGLDIEQLYTEHILAWGLAAVPILSTYLVYTNPQLVRNISPTIARIFTPVVFVTLLVFLIAMVYTGKNLYQDRDFLIIFNLLLIGVMAIILFSVTEATKGRIQVLQHYMLFGLSLLTIILNGFALSAIGFRLAEYGISPNRIAVLGANLLIFVHLILVTRQLYRMVGGKSTSEQIGMAITLFMPVYAVWTALVAFVFPLLFGYK